MFYTNYPKNRYTGIKPWTDYDWLYNEYVIKDRRSKDISDEYGCTQNTIQQWLLKHGIKKEITTRYHEPKHPYETYDYLYNQHIALHKSMAEIARENSVSGDTIRENLIKNGITPWHSSHRTKYEASDVDKMVDYYCNKKMSANEISKIFGTDHNTIIRYLKSRGVDTRGVVEAQFAVNGKEMPEDLLNPSVLHKLHWEDGLSCKEIGELYGIDAGTARRHMNQVGVKTKTNAESKIGLMTGNKHHNWKGGRTSLSLLLREFFHTNQAPAIAKRDNYTCQLCGKKHEILHIHHIKGFSEILNEICEENPELLPDNPEDRYVLYNIITHDARFLDEGNLITLCKDCHLYKIHGYKQKIISSQASKEEGSETIPTWSTP